MKAPSPALPPLSPEEVLEKVAGREMAGKTLKAAAHIAIESRQGTYSTNCALVARSPSFLRIETIPPLGPPDLFLSMNGASLKVYLPGRDEFYAGRATRENLSHFVPFRLDPDEIVPILLGTPPPLPQEKLSLNGAWTERLYRIDILSDGKKQRSLWADPSGGLVKIEAFRPDGGMSYTARFDQFTTVSGTAVPEKVVIRFEGEGAEPDALTVRIRYSDLQLSSGEEDKSLFDLEVPSGVKPIFLN